MDARVVFSTFTVFHDGQFWVGVLESVDDVGMLRAARHVFGSEPTGPELLAFASHGFVRLAERRDAAVAVPLGTAADAAAVARRRAREARRRGATVATMTSHDLVRAAVSDSKAQLKRKAAAAARAAREELRRSRRRSRRR